MAAKKTQYGTDLQDKLRDRIKTALLVKRLQDNALGLVELNSIQQRSAEICLKKVLPDLASVEHKGSLATYVARLPAVAVDVTAWTASLDDGSPTLALPNEEGDKSLISNDDKDESPS